MMTILLLNTALAWEVQTTDSGAEYHWPEMPLDYVWVNDAAPSLQNLDATVDQAFETWTWVEDADIEVLGHDRSASGEVALDEDHVVFFETDWPIGNEALAVATTWADEEGRVVSFDIRINASIPWSTSGHDERFDLQAAMTHEVGHVLGLEHSSVGDATMFAAHDVGESWRQDLHQDDQEAVQYLYGPGSRDNGKSGLFSCASVNPGGGSAAAWLWLALAPWFITRRRIDVRS